MLSTGGKHLPVDVCVVSSLQSKMVCRAAEEPGYAAQTRYAEKWTKYGDLCQAEGLVFQPVPIKVLGGFHEASVRLVKGLGQGLARSSGQDEDEVVRHLFSRLSILLQRSNSQLALNRLPQGQPTEPHVDGIM